MITEIGPINLSVSQDRAGTFQPVIVPKHKRRLGGMDQMVLLLHAKGLTHTEIFAQHGGAVVDPHRDTCSPERSTPRLHRTTPVQGGRPLAKSQ